MAFDFAFFKFSHTVTVALGLFNIFEAHRKKTVTQRFHGYKHKYNRQLISCGCNFSNDFFMGFGVDKCFRVQIDNVE